MLITDRVFDNTHMLGTPPIEYWPVLDKQNIKTKHKPHLFLNRQRCCKIYIILNSCHPVFPISSFGF